MTEPKNWTPSVHDHPTSRFKIKESKIWANRNEQYSRRNIFRIRGLKPEKGEEIRETVVKFFNNQISVNDQKGKRVQICMEYNDAAHPLSAQEKQATVIIVKFHDKTKRPRHDAMMNKA